MTSPVILYDTTLRDGAQREGLSLTVDDKLKIAGWLDQFGVHLDLITRWQGLES